MFLLFWPVDCHKRRAAPYGVSSCLITLGHPRTATAYRRGSVQPYEYTIYYFYGSLPSGSSDPLFLFLHKVTHQTRYSQYLHTSPDIKYETRSLRGHVAYRCYAARWGACRGGCRRLDACRRSLGYSAAGHARVPDRGRRDASGGSNGAVRQAQVGTQLMSPACPIDNCRSCWRRHELQGALHRAKCPSLSPDLQQICVLDHG